MIPLNQIIQHHIQLMTKADESLTASQLEDMIRQFFELKNDQLAPKIFVGLEAFEQMSEMKIRVPIAALVCQSKLKIENATIESQAKITRVETHTSRPVKIHAETRKINPAKECKIRTKMRRKPQTEAVNRIDTLLIKRLTNH